MTRHIGVLPPDYRQRLEAMSLEEIAVEAARYRSDFKRPGTATALILRWTIVNRIGSTQEEECSRFLRLYATAWKIEKMMRLRGESSRPAIRPVMGGFRYRSRKERELKFAPVHV